jgi:hypothetical protein
MVLMRFEVLLLETAVLRSVEYGALWNMAIAVQTAGQGTP